MSFSFLEKFREIKYIHSIEIARIDFTKFYIMILYNKNSVKFHSVRWFHEFFSIAV